MKITMYLVFVLFPVNLASNYFFLCYLKWDYIGAAYHHMFVSTFLVLFYILLVFSISDRIKKFLPGPTMQAFHNWGEFLKLGKRQETKLKFNFDNAYPSHISLFFFLLNRYSWYA